MASKFNSILTFNYFLYSLLLNACASTGYYQPIPLKQYEIASYRLEGGGPLVAGRIRDCLTYSTTKNCSIFICKSAPQETTGLTCDKYLSKDE